MSDQKQLKFQMVVDQNSVQQFGNAIQQMTKQLEALTKAIGQASQAMGGLLGGGNVGGQTTANRVMATGGNGTVAMPALQGGGGGPNAGAKPASLADVFLKNSSAFKNMADSSRQSMKVMTDGLAAAVRQSESNLSRLNKELEQISAAYDKVAASAKNFSNTKAELQMQAAGVQTQIAGEQKNLASLQGLMPEPTPKPGFFGRIGGWIASNGGAGWNGNGGGQGAMQSMLGSLLGGGLVAGIAAAVRLGVTTASAVRESRMVYGRAEAERGALLGGKAVAIWGNDYRDIFARQLLARDAEARKDAANAASGGTGNELTYGAGRVFKVGGRLFTLDPGGAALEVSKLPQGMQQDKLEDLEQMVENKKKSDPLLFMKMQSFYDTAGARTAFARRLGYMYSKLPNGMLVNSSGNVSAALTARGLDDGAGLAALSAVSQYGGERAGHANMMRVALAQARGFGGAAQLVGMSAQGAGENYVQHVFGAMGHGADMQAAGGLGVGLLDRMASQGQGMYDQSAILGAALHSGLFTGGGGDMLANRQIMGGLDTLNRRYSGGIDGYGKGMNIRAVAMAMQGASPQAKDYVATQMSFERMVAIASGKSRPNEVERSLGITQGQVARVLESKSNDAVRRIHGAGNGTLTGRVANAIRSSGMSTMEWARKHAGFSNKDALAGLAGIGVSTPGVSADAAIGEAGVMMGLSKGMVAKLRKSGGLGDAIKGTAEEKKNEADAKKAKELADNYAEQQNLYGKMAEQQRNFIGTYDKAAKDMNISAQQLNESFMALSQTIDMIVEAKTGNPVKHAMDSQGAKGKAGSTATAAPKDAVSAYNSSAYAK
jgi:hypothetical protein